MTNMKKMVCHTTPYFTSVCITFMNSKSFFEASGKPNILLTFVGYQISNISTATRQNSLKFIFSFGSKASKVRGNYLKVLADATFFVAFFYMTFAFFASPRK